MTIIRETAISRKSLWQTKSYLCVLYFCIKMHERIFILLILDLWRRKQQIFPLIILEYTTNIDIFYHEFFMTKGCFFDYFHLVYMSSSYQLIEKNLKEKECDISLLSTHSVCLHRKPLIVFVTVLKRGQMINHNKQNVIYNL